MLLWRWKCTYIWGKWNVTCFYSLSQTHSRCQIVGNAALRTSVGRLPVLKGLVANRLSTWLFPANKRGHTVHMCSTAPVKCVCVPAAYSLWFTHAWCYVCTGNVSVRVGGCAHVYIPVCIGVPAFVFACRHKQNHAGEAWGRGIDQGTSWACGEEEPIGGGAGRRETKVCWEGVQWQLMKRGWMGDGVESLKLCSVYWGCIKYWYFYLPTCTPYVAYRAWASASFFCDLLNSSPGCYVIYTCIIDKHYIFDPYPGYQDELHLRNVVYMFVCAMPIAAPYHFLELLLCVEIPFFKATTASFLHDVRHSWLWPSMPISLAPASLLYFTIHFIIEEMSKPILLLQREYIS